MSGKVLGATPWSREAIRQFRARYPIALAAIEDATPDSHHITLVCSRSRSPFGAVLWDEANGVEVARVPAEHPTLAAAAYAVLHSARERVA